MCAPGSEPQVGLSARARPSGSGARGRRSLQDVPILVSLQPDRQRAECLTVSDGATERTRRTRLLVEGRRPKTGRGSEDAGAGSDAERAVRHRVLDVRPARTHLTDRPLLGLRQRAEPWDGERLRTARGGTEPARAVRGLLQPEDRERRAVGASEGARDSAGRGECAPSRCQLTARGARAGDRAARAQAQIVTTRSREVRLATRFGAEERSCSPCSPSRR
jgi:hypothetical protein